jgi:hypothetical protein
MTTRAASPTPTRPRTRRALLAGALGGLAAWAASAAGRADPTAAAAGDPIRMGQFNKAGGTSTTLQTGSSGAALRVIQLHGSSAVRAEATSGRAVQALAGSDGTAVWAFSPDHYAVSASSTSGVGVLAESSSGIGLQAVGNPYAADLQGNVRMYGFQEFRQSSTPAAPIASGARLFVQQNAAGKRELCVSFATGDVIVLAAQP